MRLSGKTALITGAARGIGCAFAQAYLDEAAQVAIADIDIDRARKTANDIGAIAIEMDVTNQKCIDAGVAEAVSKMGKIDILINNAAIFSAAPIVEIERTEFQRVFDINVSGVVDGEHWEGVDAFFAKYEDKAPGQKKKEVGAAVPYGRMGQAKDLTGMAVFLASSEADYIVAQTYNVDGGNWMS